MTQGASRKDVSVSACHCEVFFLFCFFQLVLGNLKYYYPKNDQDSFDPVTMETVGQSFSKSKS